MSWLKIQIVVILLLIPVISSGKEVDEIVGKVQGVYDGISDFRADFIQESTNKALKYTVTDAGVVYFKKPGKMRWDYIKKIDEKEMLMQKIVNDGENIYYYLPLENQVMIENVKNIFPEKAPNNFLSGMGRLKEDFKVAEGYPKGFKKDSNLYYLELTPKEKLRGIYKLYIAVDKDKFIVKESVSVDPYENTTKIMFSNIEINKSIADNVFGFEMPKGVKIITPQEGKNK